MPLAASAQLALRHASEIFEESCSAHELILSCDINISGRSAASGLVNKIVEPAELIPAEALAKKITANAPLAVKNALEAIKCGAGMALEEGLFLEASLLGLCCATEDMREGTRAFIEKRSPKFQGR